MGDRAEILPIDDIDIRDLAIRNVLNRQFFVRVHVIDNSTQKHYEFVKFVNESGDVYPGNDARYIHERLFGSDFRTLCNELSNHFQVPTKEVLLPIMQEIMNEGDNVGHMTIKVNHVPQWRVAE